MAYEVEKHPVQQPRRKSASYCPKTITMMAYEVYCYCYGPQEAMVTGDCRGGFSCGELIAFLYARNYPRDQWRRRVAEAFYGMVNL